jgi:transcriptional regulator with XRE-family HTH domain
MEKTSGFPIKLRAIRASKALTQTGLAKLLGVTKKAVQDWEAGRRTPPIKSMQMIADALEVSVTDLMDAGLPVPVIQLRPSEVLAMYGTFPDDVVELANKLSASDSPAWEGVRAVLRHALSDLAQKKSGAKKA